MKAKEEPKRKLRLNTWDREAIEQAKNMIMANLQCHFTIPVLARKVHVNECKLKAGFKQLYGKGMFAYLSDERLNTAKKMLSETELSVKEVAWISGYTHLANFITTFKKRFGITPGALKKGRE